jgi:hypothetical protein
LPTAWESEDVLAILRGVFDLNAKLDTISRDVAAIRRLADEDDGEEEAPEDR